ncbi:hypothetical protein B0H34DRAFT_645680 [Crassisporium funariophilum]|nr:hypothetical protein B0H34DRAFT_645680 [Crassisporium funariophilum]
MTNLPNADILRHIVDAHCHPTDAPGGISATSMEKLEISICAMSTMQSDQLLVKDLASAYPGKVIPCFGHHPWFSHLISTVPSTSKEEHYRSLFLPSSSRATTNEFRALLMHLPDPLPLPDVLAELQRNLSAFPNAMLGEVGLDRVFRVPTDYFASPRHLTPFSIPLDHQLAVLEAQMEVAVEMGRNVSFHSVKSQQATVELLGRMKAKHGGKWMNISVDMHSCGFNPQTWRDVEKKHGNVFLSLSTVINHKHANHRTLIAACSPGRILVESDYNDIDMCTSQTWDMIHIIAEVKGWEIETEWIDNLEEDNWGVVHKLEDNWLRFQRGHHPMPRAKRNKRRDYDSEDDVGRDQ